MTTVSLWRSARPRQALLGNSLRSLFSLSRPFSSSGIRAAPEEGSAASAPVAADATVAPNAPVAADTPAAKEAPKFPPIFLSQRSPVYLKRIGRMVNNKAIRDFKRRLCYARYENERMQYKAMTHDRNLPLEVRRYFESKLNSLPRNSSITRIRNRCIISGRSRSVYRKFRMSRICLREMAGRHELMGLYKASW